MKRIKEIILVILVIIAIIIHSFTDIDSYYLAMSFCSLYTLIVLYKDINLQELKEILIIAIIFTMVIVLPFVLAHFFNEPFLGWLVIPFGAIVYLATDK